MLEVRAESGPCSPRSGRSLDRSVQKTTSGLRKGDPLNPPKSGDWEWRNSNRYLLGLMVTLGSERPSSPAAINHLYCLLFSAWFSRGRGMFRINHAAHLPGLESIFINAVPKAALIPADQSQTNLRRAFGPALAVFLETVDAEAPPRKRR